jgi:hypothetical protein
MLAGSTISGRIERFSCAVVGRGSHWVAEEVGAEEAGPILKRYVQPVRVTAPFFDERRTDPVEGFVAEASRHPVSD